MLRELHHHQLLGQRNSFVIYADDESSCRTNLVQQFNNMNLGKRLITFPDGHQTLLHFQHLVQGFNARRDSDSEQYTQESKLAV